MITDLISGLRKDNSHHNGEGLQLYEYYDEKTTHSSLLRRQITSVPYWQRDVIQ